VAISTFIPSRCREFQFEIDPPKEKVG